MRLKNYIVEVSVEEVKFVKNMITSKSKQLYNYFDSRDWVVTDKELISNLNKIFKDYNIIFSIGSYKKRLYATIVEAEIDPDNTRVSVILPKKVSEFFRRFAKINKKEIFMDIGKNQFFSELLNTLSHEYRHMIQIVDYPDIEFVGGESGEPTEVYLDNRAEIDSFSLQAALEYLKLGKPGKIIKMYKEHFSDDHRKFRNFMKKVERYKKKLEKLNFDKVF